MSNKVIEVENLYKQYQLGTLGHGLLYKDLQSWWARLRGKEDPNAKIYMQGSREQLHNMKFWALKDLSFDVKQGESLGIIGRNGAGKSTLLKILSRITAPTKGQIKIRGRVASLLEVGTGFHPELTGRENVYLNGAIHGMTRKEINKKLEGIIEFAEIKEFIDTPVKRYSSGMFVRLAFSVAAHLESEILIVDEVLAVGDVNFQRKCMGKMEDVGRKGRTILFVSHNLPAIRRLCTEGILLDRGNLVIKDRIDKVVNRYVSLTLPQSAVYIKDPDGLKDITLISAMVCNKDGEPQTDIPYNEPFNIRLEYQVNTPLNNCVVWVGIETADFIRVFDTCDYDTDKRMLGNRKKGRYLSTVNIQSHLLNIGTYRVIVGINTVNPVIEYERLETVRFNILDIGHLDEAIMPSNNRRGVIQTTFNWNTLLMEG